MNWDDLRILLELARAGTMKGAGRALGTSHTTVSRRLDGLEARAGVRLVRRIDRRLVLTDAGQALVDVAARTEDDLFALNRDWLGADARLSGPLRLTTLDTVALAYAGAFARFSALHPDIELEISTTTAVVSLSRDADVALRVTRSPPEHLVGRRIEHWPFAIYGAAALLDQHPDAELGALPWIGWARHLGARMTEAWYRRNVPDAKFAARCDTGVVVLGLLQAGAGLAFLPCPVGDALSGVRKVAPAPDEFTMGLWLLTHPDLRHAARVRALMNHLRDAEPRIALG